MAQVDTSIYSNLLRPPKSVQEYDQEAQQAEGNKLGLLLQRGQYDAQQRGVADDASYREAVKGFGTDAAANANLLRSKGLGKQAMDYEKSALDARKTTIEVANLEKTGAKSDFDLKVARKNQHLQQLVTIGDVSGAVGWINDAVKSGELPMQQATQVIQKLQSGEMPFGEWRQKAMMGGLSSQEQLAQMMKQQEFGLRANNELIGPDGKINQTLLGAKKQVAQAGASSVNVNTGQKGFDNELKLRGDFKQEPVYKAHQEMQSAYSQIQQSLKQATPAGDLAGATKIMKLLDPGSVVRESELGMAMAATGLLDRVQNYAQNIISGNKLTPKQRVEFQQLADALYGESVKAYNGKRGEYIKLGADYGLDAGRAIGGVASMAAKPGQANAGGAKFLGFE